MCLIQPNPFQTSQGVVCRASVAMGGGTTEVLIPVTEVERVVLSCDHRLVILNLHTVNPESVGLNLHNQVDNHLAPLSAEKAYHLF